MTDFFESDEFRVPEARRSARRERREEAERQARRRKRRGRTIVVLIASLAIVGAAVYFALPSIRAILAPDPPAADYPGPGTGSVMVEFAPGATGANMAAVLHEADVVASERAFIEAFNEDPNATAIQAGFYNLQLQMPAADALAALHDRENRAEISVTVPEAVRAASIYERISNAFGIPLEEVQAAAADTAAYNLPAEASGNPEGWLGAQTYILPPDSTATEILAEMVQETIGTLENLGIPRENWQSSLTMASIAEREAIAPDFPRVVRVIMNRMDPANEETRGMLGMESTVNYGLGQDGVIPTADDRAIDTPYNSFMHVGLPPTPICSPSVDAIAATVNPPEGDWNYFVTVNLDTGETRFATTWAEFQTYIQEWWDWLEANPDKHPNRDQDTPGLAPVESPAP